MIRRPSHPAAICSGPERTHPGNRPLTSVRRLKVLLTCATCMLSAPASLQAQALDCDVYARNYADAHVSGDPTDLHIVDQAMDGAVVGGAWRGDSGARRGAVAGGALGVLDTLGNDPAGWRGLYDLAYRLCRNSQSPVTHRPSTLGDPSYRATPLRPGVHEPPLPPLPLAPQKPEN